MALAERVRKYRQGWVSGLPETPCGRGSTRAATELQRKWITQVIANHAIRSVADIGAGDLNWSRLIEWGDVDYRPYDLVPRLPEVEQLDIVTTVPPRADLVMCLWVLNHLEADEAQTAVQNIIASGSTYLMVTHAPGFRWELPDDVTPWDWLELDCTGRKRQGMTIHLVEL